MQAIQTSNQNKRHEEKQTKGDLLIDCHIKTSIEKPNDISFIASKTIYKVKNN